jgi:hypothetical protein
MNDPANIVMMDRKMTRQWLRLIVSPEPNLPVPHYRLHPFP